MRTEATTVDAYMAGLPDERRAALEELRRRCRAALPGHEEAIAHGMPTYARDGAMAVAFASQRNYISLYVMDQDAVERQRAALTAAKAKIGKSCINFAKPERIPFDIVQALLDAAAAAGRDARPD